MNYQSPEDYLAKHGHVLTSEPRPNDHDERHPPRSGEPAEPAPTPSNDEFVMIGGVKKRVTTLSSLNERYALLHTPGSASVYVSRTDFLPIQDTDVKRRLAGEVVRVQEPNGKTSYPSAFNFWTGHAQRHVYRRVVFTSAQQPDDVYNLFRGLGVKPRKGCCDRIIAHVKDVICSGNPSDADAMLKLLAWQIQNVGKPSRVIVVLKSERHQAGKGILLGEVLLKIYGPCGFLPSEIGQVLGKFNDALRGRSYFSLDETVFAGDRRTRSSAYRPPTVTASRRKIFPLSNVQLLLTCGSRPITRTRLSSKNTMRATGRLPSASIASATPNISLSCFMRSSAADGRRSLTTCSPWTSRDSFRRATCRRTMPLSNGSSNCRSIPTMPESGLKTAALPSACSAAAMSMDPVCRGPQGRSIHSTCCVTRMSNGKRR